MHKSCLVGCGYWGTILKKYIRKSTRFNLVQTITRKQTYENWINEFMALKAQSIEAVFIATPLDSHFKIAKAALLSGINVFCEKPLAKTLTEVNELIGIAESRHLILYTDYIFLTSPSFHFLNKHIKKNGPPLKIQSRFLQLGKFYPNENVLETIGCHHIAALCNLLPGEITNKPYTQFFFGAYEARMTGRKNNTTFDLEFSLVSPHKSREFKLVYHDHIVWYVYGCDSPIKLISNEPDTPKMQEFCLEDSNNIRHTIDTFDQHIVAKTSNSALTKEVTSIVCRSIGSDLV